MGLNKTLITSLNQPNVVRRLRRERERERDKEKREKGRSSPTSKEIAILRVNGDGEDIKIFRLSATVIKLKGAQCPCGGRP
jgi:hypothetical protein